MRILRRHFIDQVPVAARRSTLRKRNTVCKLYLALYSHAFLVARGFSCPESEQLKDALVDRVEERHSFHVLAIRAPYIFGDSCLA